MKNEIFIRYALSLCGVPSVKGNTVTLNYEEQVCFDHLTEKNGDRLHRSKNVISWVEHNDSGPVREGWITRKYRVTTFKRGHNGLVAGSQTVLPFGGLKTGENSKGDKWTTERNKKVENFYRQSRWGLNAIPDMA